MKAQRTDNKILTFDFWNSYTLISRKNKCYGKKVAHTNLSWGEKKKRMRKTGFGINRPKGGSIENGKIHFCKLIWNHGRWPGQGFCKAAPVVSKT